MGTWSQLVCHPWVRSILIHRAWCREAELSEHARPASDDSVNIAALEAVEHLGVGLVVNHD